AFIPNTENKPCVNHINYTRNDNRLENLEWVTHQENTQHSLNKGHWQAKGEKSTSAKLNNNDIVDIRALSKTKTGKEIAIIKNIAPSTVSNILSGKKWNHI